ncbi:MAG: ABC transporter ATP-binding protein [Armatimonadetes bacterium]|nr:ABC transporter ATP-binding protein [Armatimonadota bacterium]
MIALENASRWYQQVIGINDVTCHIPPGMTALLGPNGAGKSTMLKLITGQLKPTKGRVQVLGQEPFANPKVYQKLGYCPEIENNYDEMTGYEFVTLMGALTGISSATLKNRVHEVVEMVGMTVNAGRKIGGYSKGMRQRIKVAQGIIHDPDVLILDEPMNGLDPVGRREMTKVFLDMAAAGKCVVVSSHILYEVEAMTSNILLMHRGRLMAQGNVYHIRSLIDSHPHRITITTSDARRLGAKTLDLPYVLGVKFDSHDPRKLELETHSPHLFYSAFPDIVLEGGFVVENYESPDNNLEAVFRYLVNG